MRSDFKVLPIPSGPNTQVLASKTFVPGPLDGSLTIGELYDWHLEHSSEHPLFEFSDESGIVHVIKWREVVQAIHRAGRLVRSLLSPGADSSIPPKVPRVVGILASSDIIPYFTAMMGVMRAGHTVFPISPRNSPEAVAHLLKKANVVHLLVGDDSLTQSTADSALTLLARDAPSKSSMFAFEDMYSRSDTPEAFERLSFQKPDYDASAIILHSSGTTSFPKPVWWSHYQVCQFAVSVWFAERDIAGLRMGCHSVPMFHGMGFMLTVWPASAGMIVTCFAPKNPPTVPSPDAVMQGMIDTKTRFAFSAPAFLEIWSRDPKCVEFLANLDGVMYGGGPLDKHVGDALAAKGVTIQCSYGSTECGVFNRLFPAHVDKDWEYFEVGENIKAKYISDGEGKFELVILPHCWMLPAVFNTTVDGIPAYSTGDILIPHPKKPNYWKVYGRVDDQIMHSTGEKTNPGPLENILIQDPRIKSAVMFGRGKFNAGVIIDPALSFAFDPADAKALVEFRQSIWPSVERANAFAPQQSRIFKEMILVSSPSKPFTYTAKLTARRQAILADYTDEIDKLYATVDETTRSEFEPPVNWTSHSTLEYIRNIIRTVLKLEVKDDDDIFHSGCDSLQATWIRNTLLGALQNSPSIDTRSIPMNFVYDNPSIISLTIYIAGLLRPSAVDTAALVTEKLKAMEALVEKYSADLPHHDTSDNLNADLRTVLLTGTTGGLGSALLAKILESEDVARVYALNRKGSGTILERQQASFNNRALPVSLLSSPKLVLLEGDLKGGLESATSKEVVEEMQRTVTHIIHNAYTVNFNISLNSFEGNVAALRSLIDLALTSSLPSPPRLLFTSSISVVRNYTSPGHVEEVYVSPDCAVGTGYSESKWVCERLLSLAASSTSLQPTTVRIGQMTGISTNGYWNSKEWVPSLTKSSVVIGALPNLQGTISWIPVDVAAAVIWEMSNSSAEVLHLAHPNPVPWSSVFEPVARLLKVAFVPYSQWLAKLEETSDTQSAQEAVEEAERNPALLLQGFFRSYIPDDGTVIGSEGVSEAMGLRPLSLRCATAVSPTLKGCAPLSYEDARKWLSGWKLC